MTHPDQDDGHTEGVDATPEPEAAPATGAQLWALSPSRRALHWIVIAGLLVATVVFPAGAVAQLATGTSPVGVVGSVGFACCTLFFAIQQLRAGVAVWLDPADSSLIVFRAAGGTLRTSPGRVERIDRGRIDGRRHSPASSYPPLRLVTAEGTVTLSPFLTPASGIADAIAARHPHVQIDL